MRRYLQLRVGIADGNDGVNRLLVNGRVTALAGVAAVRLFFGGISKFKRLGG